MPPRDPSLAPSAPEAVSVPDMTPAELGLSSNEAIPQPDGVAPAPDAVQRVTAEAVPTVGADIVADAENSAPNTEDFRPGGEIATPMTAEAPVDKVQEEAPNPVLAEAIQEVKGGLVSGAEAETETLTVEQAAKAFATAWEELQNMHSLSDPKAFNTKLEEVNKLMVEYNIKALSQDVAALPETEEPGEEAPVVEPVADVAPVAPPTNEVAGVRVPGQAVEPQPLVGRTGELEQTAPVTPAVAETVSQQDAA